MEIKTNLKEIGIIAKDKQEENDGFSLFLKKQSHSNIDSLVFRLNEEITPQIDCTQCGNCCKTLMIQVDPIELKHLSAALQMSEGEFEDAYIEKGCSGKMLINTIPCHFLSENKCSVYEHRFSSCREFPALHLPQITSRLFTIFMHYDRCPIIFNVIESLKQELSFTMNER